MLLNKLSKAIAAAAFAMSLTAVPQQAYAFSDFYYNYATNIKNAASQRNFVDVITKSLERRNAVYENIVAKYGHYSWAKIYVDRLATYTEQLTRWKDLQATLNSAAPAVIETVITTKDYVQVKRGEEYLYSTVERTYEETEDNIVSVFEEFVRQYATDVTTRSFVFTYTTKHYSDGTKFTTTSGELKNTEITQDMRTDTETNLLRQYALVVEEDVGNDQSSTKTVNILTEEEYLARPDVIVTGTDAYLKAAQNQWSGFKKSTIDLGWAEYGRNLEQINAPAAWARGWTGLGSTIAILDSGIDTDHPEFVNRILDLECFSYGCDYKGEAVDDISGHGTHVAGIAAAALDGEGMTGVAPDANLLIGKITTGAYGMVNMTDMAKALAWAANNNAVVANVSANTRIDTTYKNSLVKIEDGLYRSTDSRSWKADGTTFADNGYFHILDNAFVDSTIAAMSGNEMVLVASAGNDRSDITTFPAHLAVLEDENGELALGGRVIVAGNYDAKATNGLNFNSNKAGTVCFDYNEEQNTCNNQYRISDYYLMAPGSYVMSTNNDGEYETMSGTSMAAPHITGGIALLHQQWPHMTGENLVKLLLSTGDKAFAHYDEHIHGQGMMDLDEATSPQGVIGIPTTGRVNGETVEVDASQSLNIAGASVSALDEMMVIDDYDRDFYINGNELISGIDTRTVQITKAVQNNTQIDEYAGYARGITIPVDTSLNTIINVGGGNGFGISYQVNSNLALGVLHEDDTFLGNYADNAIMDINGGTTLYLGYEAEQTIARGINVFGAASFGVTELNVNSDAMMKSASTVLSNSARVGTRFVVDNRSTFGLVAALPVAITDADATFEMPTSVSLSGDIHHSTMTSSLANNAREYSVGMFYDAELTPVTNLSLFAELRNNYAGESGATKSEFGIKLIGRF